MSVDISSLSDLDDYEVVSSTLPPQQKNEGKRGKSSAYSVLKPKSGEKAN